MGQLQEHLIPALFHPMLFLFAFLELLRHEVEFIADLSKLPVRIVIHHHVPLPPAHFIHAFRQALQGPVNVALQIEAHGQDLRKKKRKKDPQDPNIAGLIQLHRQFIG